MSLSKRSQVNLIESLPYHVYTSMVKSLALRDVECLETSGIDSRATGAYEFLEHVVIDGGKSYCLEVLPKFSSRVKTLEWLNRDCGERQISHLVDRRSYEIEGIGNLAEKFPNLVEIEYFRLKDKDVWQILKYVENLPPGKKSKLQSYEIDDWDLSDESTLYTIERCPKMETFRYGYLTENWNHVFQALHTHCPKLRQITIDFASYEQKITLEMLTELKKFKSQKIKLDYFTIDGDDRDQVIEQLVADGMHLELFVSENIDLLKLDTLHPLVRAVHGAKFEELPSIAKFEGVTEISISQRIAYQAHIYQMADLANHTQAFLDKIKSIDIDFVAPINFELFTRTIELLSDLTFTNLDHLMFDFFTCESGNRLTQIDIERLFKMSVKKPIQLIFYPNSSQAARETNQLIFQAEKTVAVKNSQIIACACYTSDCVFVNLGQTF